MFTICLTGTYVEFPVQITIDPTVQESVLSTQFACCHNMPHTVLTVRGVAHPSASRPVVVPTGGGWFHSCLPFKISSMTPACCPTTADHVSSVGSTQTAGHLQIGQEAHPTLEIVRCFETWHANSRRCQPSVLCLQQKDKSGGRP